MPIVGGPLHGQMHSQGRGRRPLYLNPQGGKMDHRTGRNAQRWRHRDLYVLKRETPTQLWYHWTPRIS